MTKSTEELISESPDKFLFVLEYWKLYGDSLDYQQGILELEKYAEESTSIDDKINVELGVVFMKRSRSSESLGSLLRQIDNIAKSVRNGERFAKRLEVVRLAIKLIRSHDLINTHRQLELLYSALKTAPDQLTFGLVAWYLGISCMWSGDQKRSEDAFHDALSAFRRFDHKIIHAFALADYGVLKKRLCQYDEAERILRRALVQFASLNLRRGIFAANNNLGVLCLRTGDWRAAERYFDEAQKALRRLELDTRDMSVYLNRVIGTNHSHFLILRREFIAAEQQLLKINQEYKNKIENRRLSILASEFLGEIYTETGQFERANNLLEFALEKVNQELPDSDVYTEVTRRLADLCRKNGELMRSKNIGLKSVKTSKKIGDKYEQGAALRILAETFAALGQKSKAISCFESSVRVLKQINECYELMRSCTSYGSYLINENLLDAESYLIEARRLANRLELDYYVAKISTEQARLEMRKQNFVEARAMLTRADAIGKSLQISDKKQLESLWDEVDKKLENEIFKASISGAKRLKAICRVYEEARFPMEELKADLAYQVAQSLGAESLFVIGRRGKGYKVPLAYNIAIDEAKETVRRLDRSSKKPILGITKDPKVYHTHTDHSLVCVRTESYDGYALCTRIKAECRFEPRQFEYLLASAEAIFKIALGNEEKSLEVGSEFLPEDRKEMDTHPGGSFKSILTVTPDMIRLTRLAERASVSNETIMLEGETGVGKELFARAIHESSRRSRCGFIAINAGGMPVNFLESQLFGHVKGAFTDAVKDRKGLIEDAEGGTLFLDEVGEMGPELQVKFLRLLENGEYRRLGENEVRVANVRLVSATNRELQREVEKGAFRRDLFYRLGTVRLHIPPLRFRQRDIGLLARHFLKQCAIRNGQPGRYFEVDTKAMEALELYDWPGNVRELQNEIRRIVSLMGETNVIRFEMLSSHIKEYLRLKNRSEGLLERSVEHYERRLILEALSKNDWNRLRTAEELGLPRTTLLAKMRRLNVAAR